MAYTYGFKYGIGDKVKLTALEQLASVDAMMIDSSGAQYRVVYWINCERKTTWVYEWELEP